MITIINTDLKVIFIVESIRVLVPRNKNQLWITKEKKKKTLLKSLSLECFMLQVIETPSVIILNKKICFSSYNLK